MAPAILHVHELKMGSREAVVTGKGNRQQTVKFDDRAVQALDRYLRERKGVPVFELRRSSTVDLLPADEVTLVAPSG